MGRWVTLEDEQHVYINDKGQVLPRGPGTKPTHRYKGARSEAERGKTAALVAKARAKRAGKPTLREQAAATRAAKGTAEERKAVLLTRAKEALHRYAEKGPDQELADRLKAMGTKKGAAEAKKIESQWPKYFKESDVLRGRLKPLGHKTLAEQAASAKPPTPTLREQAATTRVAKGTAEDRAAKLLAKTESKLSKAGGDSVSTRGKLVAAQERLRTLTDSPRTKQETWSKAKQTRDAAETKSNTAEQRLYRLASHTSKLRDMTAAKSLHEHAQEAANAVPAAKRFGDKAFLVDVHHEYQKTGGKLSLAEFKQKLADSPEARVKLQLSRNDLNAREDHAKTQASEAQVKSGGRVLAEYHFVTTKAKPRRSK